MPHQLFLLRHGKSSWKDPTLDDYDRPLKKRGRRDATHMGWYLRDQALRPDQILSSTANRARGTTERLCRAMNFDLSSVIFQKNLYFADQHTLIQTLRGIPNSVQRAMLVGHNPDLEELAHELSAAPLTIPEDGKLIPTATLVHFELTTDWAALAPGTTKLVSITRPHGLVAVYDQATTDTP
ncbi:SixA phosphatase family protein [Acanthopleuribacter pedis]|uniref:Histidine phosphatase family protein n=1 Tax=Acanthopleuribacter pedis TaxID=442870 RepID=A0A8J7QBX1_9BACT|nr:histidine phosphatase family protein [Acanthopleuribacter pedis]MBO1321279.1 histidine phosphatase family protein [Acanthopleuribacter pedis]